MISRTVRIALVCGIVLSGCISSARAQNEVVPGSRGASLKQQKREYLTAVRRGVGIFSHKWETACNTHNADDATDLYEKSARITTTAGTVILGHDSIRVLHAQGLPRMSGCRMDYDDINAIGDVAVVTGTVRYDVAMATGGSTVEHRLFQMVLRQAYEDDWRISSQMGGDLPPVITTITPRQASVTASGSDSVGVRITDGLGHPIKSALVVFSIDAGHGTLSPLAVVTDADGRAMVRFTAGTVPELTTIRATTSLSAEAAFLRTEIVASSPDTVPAPTPALSPAPTPTRVGSR